VPSLGGATVRYKPVIPLTVIGPTGQVTRSALVDSGADDVVLPTDIAAHIGVDLSAALPGQAHSVAGPHPVGVFYAPVILLLSDQRETCRWRAVVAFTQAPLRLLLFGIAGGLEHFRTTLDVVDRDIILVAKPTLPATQDPVP
jgi:hypothetical protein